MNMKTLSIATALVVGISGAALAQKQNDNGTNAGNPTKVEGQSTNTGANSGAMGTTKSSTPGAMTGSGGTNSTNTAAGTHNDNGVPAGNPASSGSGTPNAAGATR